MKTLLLAASLLAAIPAFSAGSDNFDGPACFPSRELTISKKLRGIIIPKVDFRNVTVSEAIEFLRIKSKQLDPEGTGVNTVLKLPTMAARPAAAPKPAAVENPRAE